MVTYRCLLDDEGKYTLKRTAANRTGYRSALLFHPRRGFPLVSPDSYSSDTWPSDTIHAGMMQKVVTIKKRCQYEEFNKCILNTESKKCCSNRNVILTPTKNR